MPLSIIRVDQENTLENFLETYLVDHLPRKKSL